MRQFIIEDSFWEIFPQARIGVLLIKNIDNKGRDAGKYDIYDLLDDAHIHARKHLTEPIFSQNPPVAVWREAFQKFKTKKGVRSSIEALLKRIEKNNDLNPISPLVDIYNSASLEYAIPCGMEDLDAIQGDLRLKVTGGNDPFFALGDSDISHTLPGEVAYLDEEGAVCRCWNWRDGQRTMITEETKKAIAVMELPDEKREDDLREALNFIRHWVEKTGVGQVATLEILSKNHPHLELI